METGRKTGRASVLLFLRKLWAGILNLFVISYLARILTKADFGLILIAGSLINIVVALGPGSIGDYLIYKISEKGVAKNDLINSAFWLNILVVSVIIIITLLLTPVWSYYYHDSRVTYLIYILMLGFIADMLCVVPLAILKRDLNFKPIIVVQTITGTASQLSQLGLAIMGFGVYSLAIPTAIFPAIGGVYLLIKAKPKIHLHLGTKYWKGMLSYIRYPIGSKMMDKVAMDGDSLILGKVLGFTSLGVYNLSNKLTSLLNQHLVPILDDFTLPVFSRYNQNRSVLKKQYLYVTRIISLGLTPFYSLLIIFAPIIIGTLYGDKWADAVLPLQILSVFSFVKSISYPTKTLYYSLGKPKIEFYFTLFFTPIFLLLVWLFSYKGLIAACISITISRIGYSAYHIIRTSKLLSISPLKFLKEINHIIIPNILLGFAFWGVLHFIHNTTVKYLMMLMYAPMVYFISYHLYRKNFLKDFLLLCMLFPGFKRIATMSVAS